MNVPTTGMKLSGRYSRYRISAFGVNLAKGFLASFPSRAMLFEPALTCRPSSTRFVHCLDSRVPSEGIDQGFLDEESSSN